MNKDLLYLFLTLWVSSSALAQKLVRIHVVESQSMRSVSFAKVSVADTAFIADISGGFSVNIPENEKLLIERFPYENYTLHSDSIFSDTFTVELKKKQFPHTR